MRILRPVRREASVGVVIGDAHWAPGQDFRRARVLHNVIDAFAPDVVVTMGDWHDMPSLCRYSKKRELEGARIAADIEVGDEAAEIAFPDCGGYELVRVMGNHEQRLLDYTGDRPELDGGGLGLEFGRWPAETRRVPYGSAGDVCGFAVAHHLPSGIGGKPITSQSNLAASLLSHGHCGSIVGHDHRFHHARATTFLGRHIDAFNAGCFVDQSDPAWAGNAARLWSRGVLILYKVFEGSVERWEWLPWEHLKENYQ